MVIWGVNRNFDVKKTSDIVKNVQKMNRVALISGDKKEILFESIFLKSILLCLLPPPLPHHQATTAMIFHS